jgi:hypothetical protein
MVNIGVMLWCLEDNYVLIFIRNLAISLYAYFQRRHIEQNGRRKLETPASKKRPRDPSKSKTTAETLPSLYDETAQRQGSFAPAKPISCAQRHSQMVLDRIWMPSMDLRNFDRAFWAGRTGSMRQSCTIWCIWGESIYDEVQIDQEIVWSAWRAGVVCYDTWDEI